MIANLLDRTVEVSDCVESVCYGAAKLAAGAMSNGWDGAFAIRRFEPDAMAVGSEECNYRRYLRFYEALIGIYESDY